MNIQDIIATRQRLDSQLRTALATMERKDTVRIIKEEIKANQNACPHFDVNYKLSWIDGTCPYCGKKNVEE